VAFRELRFDKSAGCQDGKIPPGFGNFLQRKSHRKFFKIFRPGWENIRENPTLDENFYKKFLSRMGFFSGWNSNYLFSIKISILVILGEFLAREFRSPSGRFP